MYNEHMELSSFFNPSSIAIVGVSDNPKKVGYLVAKNCIEQGYKGELHLINPKYKELLGKQVTASLKDIGKPVDLTVLAVPADVALKVLDDIRDNGCRNVVLYAAGFKETSEQGALKELLLTQKLEKYGITLLGPNCIGFASTVSNTNVTFLKHLVPKGNIGCISQSGALGSLMVDYMTGHKNFGFSYFISLGNKTAFDECDGLEFLGQDKDTSVIAMYLEDVKNGSRFMETLARVARKKPVIILKSGSTEEGSKAAVSHTGSMMGDDAIYDAAFAQSGAIRAHQLFEFMAILKLYAYDRVPQSKDILILSNAGGVGVLLTDELIKRDMSLVTVTEEVKADIVKSMGSDRISFHNPIDLLGDASAFHYKSAIRATIKEKKTGAVIILLTPQANTEIEETASVIGEAQEWFDTPLYPVFMGEKSVGNSHLYFEEKRIASFSSYDFLPVAIAKIVHYRNFLDAQKNEKPPEAVPQPPAAPFRPEQKLLNLQDSMSLLKGMGVPVLDLELITDTSKMTQYASSVGYPLVAKIASDTITHKTDVKGIITGISDAKQLDYAWKELTSVTGEERIYLQKQVKGHELIIGAKRDRIFGPVVLLGMGGIYAELLKEAARLIYPFDFVSFKDAIGKTKLKKLLSGFRGSKPVDLEQLFGIARSVGAFFAANPRVQELDINPLMATDEGVFAIDGRVVLA
jgi:acetyltransferase